MAIKFVDSAAEDRPTPKASTPPNNDPAALPDEGRPSGAADLPDLAPPKPTPKPRGRKKAFG